MKNINHKNKVLLEKVSLGGIDQWISVMGNFMFEEPDKFIRMVRELTST